ncbi:MAG: UDPGP type 1 family protein [Clostridia bacterium]|nr:UDPGP type 1 family protein [Clostridia bacterium]
MEEVREILKQYNQEQLLTFYDKMGITDKEKLLNQILEIDFEKIFGLYKNANKKFEMGNCDVKPIDYIDKEKLSKQDIEKYYNIGKSVIEQGKIAVITMAGGQGTRLGHTGPKGTFDIGLDSHKSIFGILCDIFIKAKKDFNKSINWYIMTSEDNDRDTRQFFKENNYFGYDCENIIFFKQGQFPVISEDGKLLLDENGFVKQAPNGHGGIFQNLRKNGILDDMKNKGIQWVFVSGVDNILVKPIDPIFIGASISKNVLIAGKSLVKAYPEEKVGVFCLRNGRPSVIEYTEVTDEMANLKTEDGELAYGESHIICNMFSVEAIERLVDFELPYHVAHKKIVYMNEKGEIVKPESPNAYKFEGFIFDTFPEFDDMLIFRVKREEEFAPIKNKEGQDSPETARKLYTDFMKK